MNHYLAFVWGVCFSLIAGGAFALMWSNVRDINKAMNEPPKPRHPEAPVPGEEVMYVDVSGMNSEQFNNQKQKLENLFNNEN